MIIWNIGLRTSLAMNLVSTSPFISVICSEMVDTEWCINREVEATPISGWRKISGRGEISLNECYRGFSFLFLIGATGVMVSSP